MTKVFIPAFTGLRAVAALGVMLFHFTKEAGLELGLLAPPIQRGYLGIDLFFVLSGFIIHHVYRTTFAKQVEVGPAADFIRSRFARIYPVHLLTLTVMLFFFAVSVLVLHRAPEDPSAFSWTAIIASLFLVNGWFDLLTPNIPAWTVSAEWFAYLLYPAAGFLAARLHNGSRIALVLVALIVIELVGNEHPLLRISPEFALGMMAYDLNADLSLARRMPWYSGWLVTGLILASTYLLTGEHLGVFSGLFAVLLVALSNNSDHLGSLLARPVPVYLGEISYSTYMVHHPVWTVIKNLCRLAHIQISSPLVVCVAILLAIGVSALTFRFVELPARQALRSGRREARKVQIES
jgi:peptidoglycan/LPS O-acetylase OafA/YrhL